ncbi:MAG: hypothetical protein DRJ15_09980 [Bacteroidetes bacterium]|nr:MAG: hypothetical protein DRJ15_09980 [Bacteroidota bacterium]
MYMKVSFFIVIILILSALASFCQKGKMKTLSGTVVDHKTSLGIDSVLITTRTAEYSSMTDKDGNFTFTVPRKYVRFKFKHIDYKTKEDKVFSANSYLVIRLGKLKRFGPATQKFAIAWLPFKLLWGALGMKVEGFVNENISLGTYFDWYISGFQYFGGEKYTGFKASPFFRYYMKRDVKRGVYAQVTGIIGYFDFHPLNYSSGDRYPYEYSTTYMFWMGGGGLAFGAYFVLSDTKLKHMYFDLNAGLQIFTAPWPMTAYNSNGMRFEHYPQWWYFGGPGSIIEIKLAIGGMF